MNIELSIWFKNILKNCHFDKPSKFFFINSKIHKKACDISKILLYIILYGNFNEFKVRPMYLLIVAAIFNALVKF